MDVRLSMNFQQNADIFYRWTENWFFAGPTTFQDPTQPSALKTFLDAAEAFHGYGNQLVSVRQVDLNNLRNVKLSSLNYGLVAPTGGVTDADIPTTAILYAAVGATTGRTVRGWIRGVRDGMVNFGGKLQRSGTAWASWNAYRPLIASFCGLRTRVATAKINVTAIDLVTGTVTAAGHTFAPGDLIYLYRTRGVPYLHQSWIVGTTVPTVSFTLKGWQPTEATGVLDARKAYAAKLTYALEAIKSIDLVRATAHETARPLDRLPGRRKTRR